MRERALLIAGLLPILWLGFVLAISFMEAPLKFTVPQASYVAALSIGQVVFRAMARVELALLMVLIAIYAGTAWPSGAERWLWALAAVVLVQHLWLLPQLDARTSQIVAGQPAATAGYLHTLYVVSDCAKVVLLPGISWSLLRMFGPIATGGPA